MRNLCVSEMAMFRYRQSQQPQMGWILGEHGSEQCISHPSAHSPQKMSMGAPELPYFLGGLKWLYLAVLYWLFLAVQGPPHDISVWSKRPKLTPPDVENIVQCCIPMFNPSGVAGSAYGQIWPFWAKKSHKMAIKWP